MMPAERVEPAVWYISAANADEAIRVMRHAKDKLIERERSLAGAKLDHWPGYEIRVYVTAASRLLAHEKYGNELQEIAAVLARDGLVAGIRLVMW